MQPLTLQKLAANAYRTLGISASSDQGAIEAAARKMRIWPDPSRIPPTPFDLPWLGTIGRSRNDIEQAVSRLHDPASRVEERLLWYHAPPRSNPDLPLAVAAAHAQVSVIEQHTAALTLLHHATIRDPKVADTQRWRIVMERLSAVAASPETEKWQLKIEADGQFDKRASEFEIVQAIASVPIALADALVPKAQEAIDRNDMDACAAIISLLRAGTPARQTSPIVNGILDRLEDSMGIHCRELDRELREKLRTNHQQPQPYYAANYAATLIAAQTYNDKVLPLFTQLRKVAAGDEDRQLRVRTTCAENLALLGLGWEWSGQFVLAEQTLQHGLELAVGTAVEPGIRNDLERVAPRAEHERQWGQPAAAPASSISYQSPQLPGVNWKQSRSDSGAKGKIGGGVAVLFLIVKLIAVFSTSSNSSSSRSVPYSRSPTPSIPSFSATALDAHAHAAPRSTPSSIGHGGNGRW